jgi:hypothetical protein
MGMSQACDSVCSTIHVVPVLQVSRGTAFNGNDKAGAADHDSRRAVGPLELYEGYFGLNFKSSGAFRVTFSF